MTRYANAEQTIEALAGVGGLTVSQLRSELWDGYWEDMQFPAAGINLPGLAADPTRNTTTGLLEFSGSIDNVIAGSAQLSHRWKPGTTLRPHIHIVCPTSQAASSRWKFEYNRGSPTGDFEHELGTYSALPTVTYVNPQNVKKHGLLAFGDLPMAGYKESSVVLVRISRLSNSDGADDQSSIVTLVSYDIHYSAKGPGTPTEIPA